MPKNDIYGMSVAILAVAITALTTWMFKIDDRQFEIQSQIVTRQELRAELNAMERGIDVRLARIELLVKELVDRERERLDNGP
jgi:hypothetical protein